MNLSLDDVIANKRGSRRGRGGGGGRGAMGRGTRGGGRARPVAGSFSRSVPSGRWEHDRFEGGGGGGGGGGLRSPSSLNASSKLLVGNLAFNVSDADIEELFGEFGPLKRACVHYDRSGRSLGSADVLFERRVDAHRALKQYNNVPLDGRPMKISIVGPGGVTAVSESPRFQQNGQSARRGMGRSRGEGGRGRGRGSGRGGFREKKPDVTVEDLDKELDAYVNKME